MSSTPHRHSQYQQLHNTQRRPSQAPTFSSTAPTYHGSSTRASQDNIPLISSAQQLERVMMDSKAVNIERKMSHGIGGAGNYRRPSDYGFKEQQEEGMDGSERRSSVWSKLSSSGSPGTSPSNRRGSILNMFRKNSIAEAEKPEGEN